MRRCRARKLRTHLCASLEDASSARRSSRSLHGPLGRVAIGTSPALRTADDGWETLRSTETERGAAGGGV